MNKFKNALNKLVSNFTSPNYSKNVVVNNIIADNSIVVGQSTSAVDDSKDPLIEKEISLGSKLTSIVNNSTLSVEVVKSNEKYSNTLILKGTEQALNAVLVSLDGKLKISTKNFSTRQQITATLYVDSDYISNLKTVKNKSTGNIKISVDCNISGIDISSTGSVSVSNLNSENLTLKNSSVGNIVILNGKVGYLFATATNTGNIDLQEVETLSGKCVVTSIGNIEVYCKGSLTIEDSFIGKVKNYG